MKGRSNPLNHRLRKMILSDTETISDKLKQVSEMSIMIIHRTQEITQYSGFLKGRLHCNLGIS